MDVHAISLDVFIISQFCLISAIGVFERISTTRDAARYVAIALLHSNRPLHGIIKIYERNDKPFQTATGLLNA
jgi:hypothetical protein